MFKILFSDDFYYANKTADVTFYVEIDGRPFPDKEWTDFAIVVLSWWISAILKNHQKESVDFVLNFMDGPYYINCHKEGRNVHMECIEDKKRTTTICECDVEFSELITELTEASSKMIQLVEKHGLEKMRDFAQLKKVTKQIKAL